MVAVAIENMLSHTTATIDKVVKSSKKLDAIWFSWSFLYLVQNFCSKLIFCADHKLVLI